MIVLGLNCKLFRGAAGATANALMENVKNVTLDLSTGEADVTTRAAQGWRVTAATLKEATCTTEMLYDPGDADFNFVLNAFLTNSPIALFVTDGQGSGLDADFIVSQCGQNQDLEAGVSVNVTFKPTLTNRAPKYIQAGDESDSSSSASASESNP